MGSPQSSHFLLITSTAFGCELRAHCTHQRRLLSRGKPKLGACTQSVKASNRLSSGALKRCMVAKREGPVRLSKAREEGGAKFGAPRVLFKALGPSSPLPSSHVRANYNPDAAAPPRRAAGGDPRAARRPRPRGVRRDARRVRRGRDRQARRRPGCGSTSSCWPRLGAPARGGSHVNAAAAALPPILSSRPTDRHCPRLPRVRALPIRTTLIVSTCCRAT